MKRIYFWILLIGFAGVGAGLGGNRALLFDETTGYIANGPTNGGSLLSTNGLGGFGFTNYLGIKAYTNTGFNLQTGTGMAFRVEGGTNYLDYTNPPASSGDTFGGGVVITNITVSNAVPSLNVQSITKQEFFSLSASNNTLSLSGKLIDVYVPGYTADPNAALLSGLWNFITPAWTNDTSGNNLHLTQVGSTVSNVALGTGPYGRTEYTATGWNGASNYLSAGDVDALDGMSNLTLIAWMWRDSLSTDFTRAFCSKGGSFTENWYAESSGAGLGGVTNWIFVAGGSKYTYTTDCTLTTNVWQHLTWVFDGSGTPSLTCYVNGIQRAATTVGPLPVTLPSSTKNFTLGADPDNGRYWAGKISGFRAYAGNGADYSLTSNEVWTLYNLMGGSLGPQSNTVSRSDDMGQNTNTFNIVPWKISVGGDGRNPLLFIGDLNIFWPTNAGQVSSRQVWNSNGYLMVKP